jgi:DNA-binding phage protein
MSTTKRKQVYQARLADPKYARGLLKAAFEESIEDGNWEAFGLVLQDIIGAQGDKVAFAKKVKMSRQHLYRLFGKGANPTLKTLSLVLAEFGCKLTIAD